MKNLNIMMISKKKVEVGRTTEKEENEVTIIGNKEAAEKKTECISRIE